MSNPSIPRMILFLFLLNVAYSYPGKNPNLLVLNFTQCFDIINSTTILKKSFFYNSTQTKEQCTKIALAEKYKEDIYIPKYLHKCFPLCNSCSEFSRQNTKMKCLSCFHGFKLENGNCYLNQKYNSKQRKKELNTIFNTLNLELKINSNEVVKKIINGEAYYFKEEQISNFNYPKFRRLYAIDDYDDSQNAIFNREDQSTLTNDKSEFAYNFHIELSPYYFIAQRCVSKGKFFIENDRCVDECSPSLEKKFGYTEIIIPIKVDPNNVVKVCDCAFRCCKKIMNNLYKSLDRGFIDRSYQYFKRQNGFCIKYNPIDEEYTYYDITRKNAYLLAQDVVPCYFPIYDDEGKFEFYFTGYQRTIVGNNCPSLCPNDDPNQFYFYNEENNGCYKCPENCVECDGIPTEENGHCVKCNEYYYGIFNGFCVVLCPEGYGEKNDVKYICQKCEDDEIRVENKCFSDRGNINYGTAENPSYPDPTNSKLYHRCVEYISYKNYIYTTEPPECSDNVECPKKFFKQSGKCVDCPVGCYDCNGAFCSSCIENFILESNFCVDCSYKFFDGKCAGDCPSPDFFHYYQNGEYMCTTECDPGSMPDSEYSCTTKCNGASATIIAKTKDNFCLLACDFDYPESIDGKCINCALYGKLNYNGKCVIIDENTEEMYYKLPGEENEKLGKVEGCFEQTPTGEYIHKKDLNKEYNEEFCTKDCPTGYLKKYYEDNTPYCFKCYETCETCIYTGEAGNHKCTQCKEGYEWSNRMYGVCDQICQPGEFFYYEDTRDKKCASVCPPHKPYMLEKENEDDPFVECIGNCTINNQLFLDNSNQCLKRCPEGYFIGNLTCYYRCPDGYGPLFGLNECFNCNNYSLFSFEGYCYKVENPEDLPKNTYIKIIKETTQGGDNTGNDGEEEEEMVEEEEEQEPEKKDDTPLIIIPGVNNDGKLHNCFEPFLDGYNTAYFFENNNCETICPEGYYYYSSSFIQYCTKCSSSCLYCDPFDGECVDQCPPSLKKYKIDDDFSCIENCPDDKPIYIDTTYTCVDHCTNLNDKKAGIYNGDEKEIKCISQSCQSINNYYYEEANTCYESTEIPENTYYDPEKSIPEENTLSPCLIQISADEYSTGFFYEISNCKIQCPEHYYYVGNNKCVQCHPLCNTCFGEGNDIQNNCITCLDTETRILNPYLFNCEKKCEGSFHYDETTKLIVCDDICEKNSYIDEETGKCISTCNKLIEGNYCVNECSEGNKEFNGYCLKDVNIPVVVKTIIQVIEVEKPINNSNPTPAINPDPTPSPTPTPTPTQSPNPTINPNTKDLYLSALIELIEKNWNNYISQNNNTNNNFNTKDGNVSLTEVNPNSTSLLSPGNYYTILYLKEIQEKLKELYPSENSFYFLLINLQEKKSENIYEKNILPETKFKIYLSTGEEILINDLYPDLEIIIEKEIKFKKKLENNNKLAYDLIHQGINIFDINDPFFNDMCFSYQDEHGNDVVLKNRKEDYFQNILVCIDGCEYLGLNTSESNNYKIICKCKISALIINNTTDLYDYTQKDNSTNIKYDNGDNSILELIKCTDEVLNTAQIKSNKGLWIYLGFLGLLLGLYLCFCCYDFNPLYAALFPFSQNKKSGKNEEEIIEEEIITKKEYIKSVDSKETKEEIQSELSISENKENPPKKGEKLHESKTKYKISFDNTQKDYPKLNISDFGKEGYKLSNNLDKLDIDTIGDINDIEEDNKNNNISSPRSNSSFNSNSIQNSSSSQQSINYSQKFSSRQVDLEPEGALLDKNNFFDTCKIVKLPSNYSQNNFRKMSMGIRSNNLILNNNRHSNNPFYRQRKRTVKLPGFPQPKIEKNDSIEENENPINRRNKILENNDESNSSYSSGKNKKIKNEIFNKEIEDNMSEIETNSKKKKYNIKSSRRNHRKRNSLMNSITTETFSRQPITINKYYITNNTPEDISKFKNNLPTNSNRKGEKTVTIKRKKIKSNKKFFYDYFSKYDLDFADFEYALLCEKRTFCQIYLSLLSNFQIFLSVFFGNNVFLPWCVRGGIAVFTMELYFTGIAILINFNTLEKRYKFNDTVDIAYLIKNEFSSIIYTSLISKIMNVVTMYFLAHYSITKIIKEYAFKENLFLQQIKKEINCIKCKYHIFFNICIILTVLQGYYIYCFCGIYKGAIKPWIFSSLITFGLNFIMSFFIILIGTFLRKMSLYCQSWIIYLFSKLSLLLA